MIAVIKQTKKSAGGISFPPNLLLQQVPNSSGHADIYYGINLTK